MPRKPIEPGRWGQIRRREISPGVWRAQALYRDFTGVLHKYESRGPSGAAAQRRLEDRLHRASTDGTSGGGATITPESRMTVVFDQWVSEKQVEGQITPQSLATYLGVLERDLRPAFGALRVREVTPVAVNRVLMALSAARKFDTARQARNVLSQVMMMCVRYGAAPFNPVRDAVTVRKPRRDEVRALGLEDIALLRKAVREWEDRPALPRGRRNITLLPQIVDTMLGTGLRIGECLALREADLDLDAPVPTLTVTGTIVRVEGRLLRQSKPKSDTSRRTITLPAFVVAAITEALDLGLDGGPDDLVFPSTNATPRAPSRIRDQLRDAQAAIGTKVTPHDFRRTVATQVANSTTIANATALLGHADEGTTRAALCEADPRGAGPARSDRSAGHSGFGIRDGRCTEGGGTVMAEPTDFGWSRLVRHSVTVDVELRMAGRAGDAHPRPIQSGYRAQWDGLRYPDALLYRDVREAPLILASRTAVAAGEVAVARLYPIVLKEWEATAPGDRLVLVTAGSLKRLGEATVVAIHGLRPGGATASTGSLPEGKTE